MSNERKSRIPVLVIGGAILMAAGFLTLFGTSARGDNLASLLAPMLILAGLAVFGIACPKEYKKHVSKHTNQANPGSRRQ